jgi:hypothetical protein
MTAGAIDPVMISPRAVRPSAVGRGWEEPSGGDSAQNRRVEVQWFTIE